MPASEQMETITERREKPGSSNAGKYETDGPYCGKAGGADPKSYPVNTRARAISAINLARHAPNPAGIKACVCRHYPDLPACKSKEKNSMSEKQTMPKSALQFMDHDGFAQIRGEDDKEELMMVAYSGGVIPKHFYWGDLAIDLNGMSFPKGRYPILENHDTAKKIAFADAIEIDSGALVIKKASFVDTPESREFRKLSKEGFPYQSSVYASPTVIERIPEGRAEEVNGMSVEGPATVWRESTFKEASVCVFGYDPNTRSAAMSDDNIELTLETISNARSDQTDNLEKEVTGMNFEQFSKEHPELLKEIVDKTTAELTAKFAQDLAQERDSFSKEREQLDKKLAELQKAEAIRREKELRFEARSVWMEKLSNSEIPDRLYDKVITQVNYEKFVKDGSIDMEGFARAIDEEIQDWAGRGVTSNALGFGVSLKGVEDEKARKHQRDADEDETAVKELLALVNDPAAKA
jgi:hypothetical protein